METDLLNNTLQLTKQCQCKLPWHAIINYTKLPSNNNSILATMPCTEVLVNSKKLVQMATNNLLGCRVETGPLSLISKPVSY